MKNFDEALKGPGWTFEEVDKVRVNFDPEDLATSELSIKNSHHSFKFGNGYELTFEPLLFDGQFYVALYRHKELILPDKIVVKKGKINLLEKPEQVVIKPK